ncbi:F-box/LRR-repeat protein At4g14103 [Eutrema salsugineum]|nr:F-box/LRR-repeat protein At4g14103 [Eutrema salsugineum]
MIEGEDRISGLPDDVVFHIFSFLSTTEAASTSALAKRWRFVFANAHNLDFDISLDPKNEILPREGASRCMVLGNQKNPFDNVVDRALKTRRGAKLNRFSLKTKQYGDPSLKHCVSRWILGALDCAVSDLNLIMNCDSELDFLLPSNMFNSKTLATLRIKNEDQFVSIGVEDFDLPMLKTLSLVRVLFRKEEIGFENLIAGCKLLEELELEQIWSCLWKYFSVASTSLKRFTFFSEQDHSVPTSVSFDTPYLIYLDYTEIHALKYPKVNLDSLVEARINLRLTTREERNIISQGYVGDNYDFGDCTALIVGIRNVVKLYLCASTLEVISFSCKDIPTFVNLTHLTIDSLSRWKSTWDSLRLLLTHCTSLDTIVFKGLSHRCVDACLCKSLEGHELSFLTNSPATVVKVLFDDKMMMYIEHVKLFLKTMPNLEHLDLYFNPSLEDEDLSEVSKELEMVTKASTECQVRLMSNVDF